MPLQIPKKLHIIWIGDEDKRPDQWIATWRDQHPGWEFRLWGNADFHATDWTNQRHMEAMWKIEEWAGVADLMRYEILYRHGGVYMDADTICLRPLDDWLLEGEFFAAWARDIGLPSGRLVANAFLGAAADNSFLRYLIEHIRAKPSVTNKEWSWRHFQLRRRGAWRTVGPAVFTECLRASGYTGATLLPAHMFNPKHKNSARYSGGGVVYAEHFYGTTKKLYPLHVPEHDEATQKSNA